MPSHWVGSEKNVMTMSCLKLSTCMYILYMHVHTHIFIISKYEVKNTQVLHYKTESMSVRQENVEEQFLL